jgi:molecular chaperone DnaJ
MKGQNIHENVEITLEEALFGTEKQLNYNVVSSCEICDGAGATEFDVCAPCNGQGGVTHRQGNMFMMQTCGSCGGQGRYPKASCESCKGEGAVQQNSILNIAVPPGIQNGVKLRLLGKGGRGFHGGPPGDLYLTALVKYPNISTFSEEEKKQLKTLLSKI